MTAAPERNADQGRPRRLVVVAGTGTEVGKTWVTARLLEAWRDAGRTVAARKPAQSFVPGSGLTDAEVLGAASAEEPTAVCPPGRWYAAALAPPMAADALGQPRLTMRLLTDELTWPDTGVDVGVVETAGGVRSPQADDGDVVDLVRALEPDCVVLVADAGLGTINAVRLCVGALATGHGPPESPKSPAIVVLNRFNPSVDAHRRNLDWLRRRDKLDVVEGTATGLTTLSQRLARPSSRPPG